MVKRTLLEIKPDPSMYTMLGISCHLQDYRLSYLINQKLDLFLQKKDDLLSRSIKKNNESPFSFYQFVDEDNYCTFVLLSNRSEEFILIPEIKQVDYVLIIDGEIKKTTKERLIKDLKTIPNVLTSFELKGEQIKNGEMLFSDIEMHLIYLKRAEKLLSKFQRQKVQ